MFFLIFQILKFHFKKISYPDYDIFPWLLQFVSPPHLAIAYYCLQSLFTTCHVFLPFYFVLKRGLIVEKFTIRSHFFLIIHVLLFKLLSYKEKNIKDLRIFLILYKELFLFRISISSKNDSEQYSLKYKAFPLDSFYSLFNKLLQFPNVISYLFLTKWMSHIKCVYCNAYANVTFMIKLFKWLDDGRLRTEWAFRYQECVLYVLNL